MEKWAQSTHWDFQMSRRRLRMLNSSFFATHPHFGCWTCPQLAWLTSPTKLVAYWCLLYIPNLSQSWIQETQAENHISLGGKTRTLLLSIIPQPAHQDTSRGSSVQWMFDGEFMQHGTPQNDDTRKIMMNHWTWEPLQFSGLFAGLKNARKNPQENIFVLIRWFHSMLF